MTMAEKVYQARCRHRLTQVELAKRADVGQSVICKLERGTITNPSTEVLRNLALALGVSMDFLAGLYEEAEKAHVS